LWRRSFALEIIEVFTNGTDIAQRENMPSPRPFLPVTTYYLELDGVPSCCSSRRPLSSPIWSCAQSSLEEAKREALLVWRDHPDCVIAIRQGPCPRGQEEALMEYFSRYDDESY